MWTCALSARDGKVGRRIVRGHIRVVEIGAIAMGDEEDESDEYDDDYSFGGYYADDDDEGRWDEIIRNS